MNIFGRKKDAGAGAKKSKPAAAGGRQTPERQRSQREDMYNPTSGFGVTPINDDDPELLAELAEMGWSEDLMHKPSAAQPPGACGLGCLRDAVILKRARQTVRQPDAMICDA